MRKTPLHQEHTASGAKMIDYHGWGMPLHFEGIIPEHHHTREHVSLFDCSHMGEFRVKGEAAMRAFAPLVFFDLFALPVGKCKYSSLLNDCGGILDDVIVIKLAPDNLLVVSNAAPLKKVAFSLEAEAPGMQNISAGTAKIDVQGPESRKLLFDAGFPEASMLGYFSARQLVWRDAEIVLSRSGYTGELGYEFYVPDELAVPLWRTLLEDPGCKPAGLGARDTLRMEMGYTLYGQDVDESKTSIEAAMGHFIDWDRPFRGRESLWMQRETGRYMVRTGVRSFDKRAPRAGHIVRHDGKEVGYVTSGTYGPTVGVGIGMAYLPRDLAHRGVRLAVGPRELPVETADFPFYSGGTCRS